jgi:predicted glycosyltransferase
MQSSGKKIWVDLDNSPHVPFFNPIIEELEKRGYPVLITARNRFQVCELADHFRMKYKSVGGYYGKNKIVKLFWLTLRALQLLPTINNGKPHLALSHGSRSQLLLAKALRIPSVIIFDYEYAKEIPFVYPKWAISPEIVPQYSTNHQRIRFLKYSGIKEDVYIPYFKPDDSIIDQLGLNTDNLIVTVRPPATEAHYFSLESEKLFESAMDFLCELQNIQVVLLPRSEKQKAFVGRKWTSWIADGKIIIPKHAVDGLNLIWHSDFVISGGGTMNREAAALGVPVYSIFRGKIGAVDHYLSEKGRLILIENKDEIYSKIVLARRDKSNKTASSNNLTFKEIVSHIVNIIEGQYF